MAQRSKVAAAKAARAAEAERRAAEAAEAEALAKAEEKKKAVRALCGPAPRARSVDGTRPRVLRRRRRAVRRDV